MCQHPIEIFINCSPKYKLHDFRLGCASSHVSKQKFRHCRLQNVSKLRLIAPKLLILYLKEIWKKKLCNNIVGLYLYETLSKNMNGY